MDESPDEAVLVQAARAAIAAEIEHARTGKVVFVLPAEDQVLRLIAAAWPVLAGAGETSG